MARRAYCCLLDSRRGAVRREIAAMASMLALVMNLVAGLALSARPILLPGADGGLAIGFALCRSATADAAQPEDGQAPAAPHGDCIFCLPLMGGALPAGAAAGLAAPAFLAQVPPAARPPHIALVRLEPAPPARGPPLA